MADQEQRQQPDPHDDERPDRVPIDGDVIDADLADIEEMLRELDVDDLTLVEPPAAIWDGITAAIADDEAVAGSHTVDADATVVPIDAARRRRRLDVLMMAAAAVLLLAIGAAVFLPDDDSVEVIATADLAFDPDSFDPLGEGTSAVARLVEVDDHYEIEIDQAVLPSDLRDELELELWMIEADDDGQIVDVASVAVMAEELPATYVVPDSIDTATHTIVDISVEPNDDDPAHSGRSILRGTLTA